jgi:tRNA 5-methylaminomethyl-2-thiouridine biosynthesis bifunctional protein
MTSILPHHAQLTWDNNLPRSILFDDKYFCQENGYKEAQYVFCGGNDLAERFAKLGDKTFVIGETGFGTGLNFLSAWQLFNECASPNATLHFISLDQFPLNPNDLKRSLLVWPELNEYTEQLCAQYSHISPGQSQISFGRVTLTLMVDSVLSALDRMKQKEYRMDAWFLDGFDPAKNPEMWSQEVFDRVAKLSPSGTTVATFTAAGFVRRGLVAAGFKMERAKGFGRKRHMLRGHLKE